MTALIASDAEAVVVTGWGRGSTCGGDAPRPRSGYSADARPRRGRPSADGRL